MLNLIRKCIVFSSLRPVIGLENSCYPLTEPDKKTKTNGGLLSHVLALICLFACIDFNFNLVILLLSVCSDELEWEKWDN